MASSMERTSKRRRRAAAVLGIALAVVLGYAAIGDDSSAPSTTPEASPARPGGPAGADPDPDAPDSEAPSVPATSPRPNTRPGPGSLTPGSAVPIRPAPDGPPASSEMPPEAEDPDKPDHDTVGDDIELDGASRGTPEVIVPDFRITGSPAAEFYPGVSQAVDLLITNRSDRSLTLTGVTVEIGPASAPACPAGNLVMTQGFAGPVVVPARASLSLSALGVPQNEWPVLTMPDASFNQDACQRATFQLTYRGTGTMPS